MRKQAPVIEWIVAEDDADWERHRILPLPEVQRAGKRHRLHNHYAWGVAALLFLLVAAGDWRWRSTQGATQQTATTATAIAQQELAAVVRRRNGPTGTEQSADRHELAVFQTSLPATGRLAGHASSLDADGQTVEPGNPFHFATYTVDVQDDQAVTRVVTMSKHGPYRQTLFYRRTDVGWQQVYPDTLSWGPERRLETTFMASMGHEPTIGGLACRGCDVGLQRSTDHPSWPSRCAPGAIYGALRSA